jgi:hypothetical protein
MIKIGSLLNSEGPLLELFCNTNGEIELKGYSLEYEGHLIFSPKFSEVISYLESRITLTELIVLSEGCHFVFKKGGVPNRIPLDDIISSIPYCNEYYKNISDSLK